MSRTAQCLAEPTALPGATELHDGAAPDKLAALRQALAAHKPATQSPPPLPTHLAVLDAALHGGLPRGKLIELCGGTGKMAFALLALAAATQRGELCAFVDTEDGLDIQTASRVGVDLARLLWVRTPTVAARSPESGLRGGLKAVDLLLNAGGFALIVLYAATAGGQAGSLRSGAAWPRVVQRCEKTATALLIISEQAVAGSAAAATLRCTAGETLWERAPGGRLILNGQQSAIEVVRSRLGPPGEVEPLPLRK